MIEDSSGTDWSRFPRIAAEVEWLSDQAIQAAGTATGAQLCVMQGADTVVDVALGVDGQGRPMARSTLGQLRCAVSKPLIATAVASVIAEHRCDWDTPVGDVLSAPLHPDVARATLDDLLCHRAGLHEASALLLNLKPPETRLDFAKSQPGARRWRRGRDSAYAEARHALLSGAVVETLTGREYDAIINERVLGPSNIPPEHLRSRFTDREFDQFGEKIGVASARVNGVQVPFLVEATRRQATEWNPSWSGYSTAYGLAAFFRYLRDLEAGRRTNPWLPQATIAQLLAERMQDPAGRHPSERFTMGRGVHHQLRVVGIPERYASSAVGHFGWAIALGFFDRELDLAVAIRFANQCDDILNLMRLERVVSAVYADLGVC